MAVYIIRQAFRNYDCFIGTNNATAYHLEEMRTSDCYKSLLQAGRTLGRLVRFGVVAKYTVLEISNGEITKEYSVSDFVFDDRGYCHGIN